MLPVILSASESAFQLQDRNWKTFHSAYNISVRLFPHTVLSYSTGICSKSTLPSSQKSENYFGNRWLTLKQQKHGINMKTAVTTWVSTQSYLHFTDGESTIQSSSVTCLATTTCYQRAKELSTNIKAFHFNPQAQRLIKYIGKQQYYTSAPPDGCWIPAPWSLVDWIGMDSRSSRDSLLRQESLANRRYLKWRLTKSSDTSVHC